MSTLYLSPTFQTVPGEFYAFLGQGAMNIEGESFDVLVSDSLCPLTLVLPTSILTMWSSFPQVAQKVGQNRSEHSGFGEQVQHQTGMRALGLPKTNKGFKEITVFNRTQNPKFRLEKTTCYKQRKILKLAVFFFFFLLETLSSQHSKKVHQVLRNVFMMGKTEIFSSRKNKY